MLCYEKYLAIKILYFGIVLVLIVLKLNVAYVPNIVKNEFISPKNCNAKISCI